VSRPEDKIPLSLYIHFPWCARKCPYCDFNSHEASGSIPEAAYIAQLLEDLKSQPVDRSLVSIFLGGGTPSLFKPDSITQLISGIENYFDLTEIEITMEANPGTFDQQHFEGYRDAGVNRLSIGAQSFSNEHLEALGRIHTADEIHRAFQGARKAGFNRINLDLMYGLPGQATIAALKDLEQATNLGPEHISWYQLTIEPNTYFNRYPPLLPREQQIVDMEHRGRSLLADTGFIQYEISAYAKTGEASRHNLNYWQFGDYIGIGAGAHGKITRGGIIYRTTKTRVPADYLRSARTTEKAVSSGDIVTEFLMNSLRMTGGFSLEQFELTTGLSRERLDPFCEKATARRWIEIQGDHLVPTPEGQQFLNDLLLLTDW
jgi:oxygen-independent coproporphyrinogen-3 oxidase